MESKLRMLSLAVVGAAGLATAGMSVGDELTQSLIYGDEDLSIVQVGGNPGLVASSGERVIFGHGATRVVASRGDVAAFEVRPQVEELVYPDEDPSIVNLGSRR